MSERAKQQREDIIASVEHWLNPDMPPVTSSDHYAFREAVRKLATQARYWAAAAAILDDDLHPRT